jgi:uncharacterized RDD family membrane protein YckC
MTSSYLPDPATAPELFEGLLTRRFMAFLIDAFLIMLILVGVTLVGMVLGVLTLGVGWLALVPALPISVVAYYAMTLGSPQRATIGMRMMDLVLTPTRGQPMNGPVAFLHALIFYITAWISLPFSLLFALFTPRRQMIHDLITGTLMLRRSPMERHWRRDS